MKKTILTSALLLSFYIAFSQITFVKGYIINLAGDTLNGEIKMNPKKELDQYSKAFFKDASGIQKNYKPNKVKGYGFEDKHFISFKYEGEPMFYRVLAHGHITLLHMFYEMQQFDEFVLQNEYYVFLQGDKEYTRLKEGKYKKQLGELMKDNPDIMAGVEGDKKFEVGKVIELVNQYNDWVKSK